MVEDMVCAPPRHASLAGKTCRPGRPDFCSRAPGRRRFREASQIAHSDEDDEDDVWGYGQAQKKFMMKWSQMFITSVGFAGLPKEHVTFAEIMSLIWPA